MSDQNLTRQLATLLMCLAGLGVCAAAQSLESSAAVPATNYTLTANLAGTSTVNGHEQPIGN